MMSEPQVIESSSLNKNESDQLNVLEWRILFIQCFGFAIQDFARKHLNLNLSDLVHEKRKLKAAFTKLFKEPTDDQKHVSCTMKYLVSDIKELNNISEAIVRYCKYFVSYCNLSDFPKIRNLIKNKDVDALNVMLQEAPSMEKYDEELRTILVIFID